MKAILICTISLIMLVNIAACSRSWRDKEWWEGVRDKKLRVYVEIDREEGIIEDDKSDKVDIPTYLKEAAKKRAAHLLASYMVMNDKQASDHAAFRVQINRVIVTGKLVIQKCNRKKCWALFDFPVDQLEIKN
jgi:hypothetical protein